jgi:alkylhydroperoxidase family enzyme
MAAHLGASDSKIEALWEFEQSELFTDAERSALRLARDAGQSPNAATYDHFRELRDHYSEEQIVVLVGVIALFGFMNRWHETMATDLEDVPTAYATEHLVDRGWHPGRHGSTLE